MRHKVQLFPYQLLENFIKGSKEGEIENIYIF